jgi:uncharacterized protein YdcH (DUF465 family)
MKLHSVPQVAKAKYPKTINELKKIKICLKPEISDFSKSLTNSFLSTWQ